MQIFFKSNIPVHCPSQALLTALALLAQISVSKNFGSDPSKMFANLAIPKPKKHTCIANLCHAKLKENFILVRNYF
jgi:hypothetical protein